jgi:hypothetical protein
MPKTQPNPIAESVQEVLREWFPPKTTKNIRAHTFRYWVFSLTLRGKEGGRNISVGTCITMVKDAQQELPATLALHDKFTKQLKEMIDHG